MSPGMPADPNCPGCVELKAKVKSLEEQIDRLIGRLDELERAGKRQAGPFSKGSPKPNPRKPGRKPGEEHGGHASRALPTKVDEEIDVPLPAQCPGCQGCLEEEWVADQYQTDVPPVVPITRRFRVHVGRCKGCGKRVQPRHSLQTSDALGSASVLLGPNVLTFGAALNKVYGPSWAKVASLVEKFFGLKAAPSTFCRAALRLGDRLAPTYDALVKDVAASPIVYPDETGWRVGGHRRWLWVFVGKTATVYKIAPSRGGEVAAEILGAGYNGVLGRDGWAAYRRFAEALHQSCVGHLMRRAREILLVAKRGAAKFPHAILRVFKAALALRDRRDELSDHGFASLRGKIVSELDWLLTWKPDWTLNARFARHLVSERDHLLTFLHLTGLEATNWPAEQAIRPAVIARKLSGCNRSDRGARAHERITSVARTAGQRQVDVFDLLLRAFRSRAPANLLAQPTA